MDRPECIQPAGARVPAGRVGCDPGRLRVGSRRVSAVARRGRSPTQRFLIVSMQTAAKIYSPFEQEDNAMSFPRQSRRDVLVAGVAAVVLVHPWSPGRGDGQGPAADQQRRACEADAQDGHCSVLVPRVPGRAGQKGRDDAARRGGHLCTPQRRCV